ncbi:bromodomain-containing protein 4-like isoform X2 [Venturia canescens]|uniref:bromodomain-containing protein 4-like isoform X2 n=1 Tax=Venturia canescens TaxID=32260 RepID=UPI001C9CE9F6|nr:bromodomain-containing protein 4-like isoform X2 [Venturia canescens]
MAYRGVKGSDPFVSKTSRNERFAQMSKQEQIIQQKKLEIEAKMQELKAKQASESSKKTSVSSTPSTAGSSSSTTTTATTSTSPNSAPTIVKTAIPTIKKEEEKPSLSQTVNLFANDGSFLDQFKKIANNKASGSSNVSVPNCNNEGSNKQDSPISKVDESKEERNNHESNQRERRWNNEKGKDWENRRDRRRSESRWGRSSDRRHSSSSSPSPTRRRSSPSPESRHNYHQSLPNGPRPQFNQQQPQHSQPSAASQNMNQTANIPPLMSQPLLQMTNVPPPSIRNIGPGIPPPNVHRMPLLKPPVNNYTNIENHRSSPRMPIPPPHMIRPPHIQSMPPNTTIPPPGMQIQQNVPMPNIQGHPRGSSGPPGQQAQHIVPPTPPPQCNMPPLANLQPPNISMPNVRPANILPPMSQMPPNMLPIPGPQTVVATVTNVPNIPPPPPVIPPIIMTAPPPTVHTAASTINSVPPPNLNIPPPNVPPPNVPPSVLIQNPPPPTRLIATTYPIQNQMTISVGRPNVQVPPPIRPPSTSLPSSDQPEAEQLARIVADCGDAIEQEVREKNAQDPKLWFLHQKQSAAYLQYRGLVAKFRADKAGKENKIGSGAEPYCPEEALSDNDDIDKSQRQSSQSDHYKEDSREERKRKRRSRWSEPDDKVNVPAMNIRTANRPDCGPIYHQPGIAMSAQIGQSASTGIPSLKNQSARGKNPMLSKISRNDPALIQYARQTFGTLDLSEEQWKKAEDHYKINLLYQNLLKKREEVKRLEAQGKHKYEYDSDEEVEGGTWEHKIRSAEMEATQMWAEELTAQAEGKHHIGDFLPPDELKRFMEQYSALKQGKEPDLSDYKEFKLKEDNIGFQMLQKLGWSEGQGLGTEGSGRVEPVNKATNRLDSSGLGSERPDGISRDDDEFDAYRKRMMLAYRFRPNPLNNPRRPYY